MLCLASNDWCTIREVIIMSGCYMRATDNNKDAHKNYVLHHLSSQTLSVIVRMNLIP